MKSRARRRPEPNEAVVELPALFARQADDCSGGSQFYRCAKNDFNGCCSVDPCDMDDGCPDDEKDKDKDKDKDDGKDKDGDKTTTSKPKPTATNDENTTTMVTVITRDGDTTTVVTTVDGAPLPTDLPEIEEPTDDDSSGGLSGGAIAGIVIGILALLLLLAALWFWRRRKHKYTPAQTGYPPPMDANDVKFLSAADPASATTASSSTTPATLFGKLGMGGSRAPTPSTPGLSNGARNSYVSSMTSSPPPGAVSFVQPVAQPVAQLDSAPVVMAEMEGEGAARPSELPATPLAGASARGLGVQHARDRSSGGLPTVRESEADPRATLNSTEGDGSGRMYVNSWSSYEGAPQGLR